MFGGYDVQLNVGKESEEVEERVDPLMEELEAVDLSGGTSSLSALFAILNHERADDDSLKDLIHNSELLIFILDDDVVQI